MKTIFGYVAIIVALAAPVTAQPSDQRPQPEPPPLPSSPPPLPPITDTAPQRVTVPFSDPARPGTLEMSIVMGSITVKGTSRKDVLIEARSPGRTVLRPRAQDEPPAGLRRLTQNGPFSVEEDKNTISIDVDSVRRALDFTIEVPVRTNLELETVMGSVSVEAVDGDLEIESVNGPVTLSNVGGSVVAHSVNGRLLATIARLTPQKPMAFTSMNGSVDVTLPAAVKANLKLRSDQGDVYTDFDLQLRQDSSSSSSVDIARNGRSTRRVEIDKAIYGSVNGGGPDFEMRTFNGNVYVRKGK